jgi:ERCC4-type nuclease
MSLIKFDHREKKLLDYLSHYHSHNPLFQSIDIQNLPVGDIQISHSNNPSLPLIVIERKTLTDLASSIRDGRYKEQIFRLKSLNLPTRIFYILEGCTINNIHYRRIQDLRKLKRIGHSGVSGEAAYSAFLNIQVRDNFHVLESNDMADTAVLLERLLEQVDKKYTEIIGENNVSTVLDSIDSSNYQYCQILKTNKKDNINPQVCFINILVCIPGVSPNMASFICNKYPTMSDLIMNYLKIEPDLIAEGTLTVEEQLLIDKENRRIEKLRCNLLKDIEVKSTESEGGSRKIGPIVSKRVYQYLFGIVDNEEVLEK